MPTYYAPGTRKGNKTFTVRGRIAGREREIATDAGNKKDAKECWRLFEAGVIERRQPRRGPGPPGFLDALGDYQAQARPGGTQDAALKKLEKHFTAFRLDGVEDDGGGKIITSAAIHAAADILYPGCANATLLRNVIVPMRAVLYAFEAANEHRAYTLGDGARRCYKAPRIRGLKITKPAKPRPRPGAVDKLIAALDGDFYKRLLIVTLDAQGWRITETLKVGWNPSKADPAINLSERLFHFYVPKADAWKDIPMHDAVFLELAAVPEEDRAGRLFPWATRSGVYKWLWEKCREIGVTFTPHMARHQWGFERNADRRSGADMVAANTWTSVRSTETYTAVDPEHARHVLNRTQPGQKSQKTRGKKRGKMAR